jgi:MFS family permease
MKRHHLYIVYIGLWMCLLALLLSVPAKQLVHQWAGRGSLGQALFLIYALPVSLLYLLSAFLFDIREDVLHREHIISFLGRRRMLILMFMLVIIALILLMLASFAP